MPTRRGCPVQLLGTSMNPTLVYLKILLSGAHAAEPADKLLLLLKATRELATLPTNDFSWSSWRDVAHASAEIDSLISQLEGGDIPDRLDIAVIYAPTGPLQELSLSSGWADTYLEVANRFDSLEGQLW